MFNNYSKSPVKSGQRILKLWRKSMQRRSDRMSTNNGGQPSRTRNDSGRTNSGSSRVNNSRSYSGSIQKRAVKNPVPGDGGNKR